MERDSILDFFNENTVNLNFDELDLRFYNSDIAVTNFSFSEKKLKSIIFNIEPEGDILKKIIQDFGNPVLGMESFLNKNSSENFHFGRVKGEDFLYDANKLYNYIILVWRWKNYTIQYFKNNSEFNNENSIRFEIATIENEFFKDN